MSTITSPTPFSPRKIGPTYFDFSRPYVMGILNITPDSFSDGGQFNSQEKAFAHACQMLEEGVDIIDIGGESTRPGAKALSEKEELARILPIVKKISRNLSVTISVDTYKANVAKAVIEEGAHLINDISMLQFDPALGQTLGTLNVPVILMHSKERPETMQQNIAYTNVVEEVRDALAQTIVQAESFGVAPENIWVDPGFGFGKRHIDNRALLLGLPRLETLGKPLVVGLSRKSTLGVVVEESTPKKRLGASVAAATLAVFHGAQIIRAHDIKETIQAVKIAKWARDSLSNAK